MFDWLKILGLTVISPARGLGEAYSRSMLVPSLLLLLITQTLYSLYAEWSLWLTLLGNRFYLIVFAVFFGAFIYVIIINAIFVPAAIAVSNFFERRGNLTQTVQQEFTSTASTVSYAYAAINILGLLIVLLAKKGGLASGFANFYASTIEKSKQDFPTLWRSFDEKQFTELISNKEALATGLFPFLVLPVTVFFVLMAVRVVFRMSWMKTIVITMCSFFAVFVLRALFSFGIGFILGSPVLLLLSFFLLQGYFREIARRRQAEVDFKRSLETATLNPADASAHYNLGLLHQQRNNLDEARKSFEKAVEIDADELDAHYQLGKIARAQNRLQDAINHFTEVVSRSQNHAQYEIWREVGATYIAANQYADAKDALENFLSERPTDPEGLYLMGRAQAGLGDKRAAIATMQACIQAVKTAPTYKNRLEQRWLNEAEKFLKTNA